MPFGNLIYAALGPNSVQDIDCCRQALLPQGHLAQEV